MAQPTPTGLTLNAGSAGDDLAKTTHGGYVYQWAFACWWNESDSSPEVPTLASPLPTQPGTGTVWIVDLGANNDVTMAVLPDTATGDLAAMVVDLAALEVLVTAGNALLTAIDADTSRIPALGQAVKAASVPVVFASDQDDIAITLAGESVAVTGTFWQATQPVSLASVPSHAVTNAGTFAVQAAQSGTWNITNVSGTISLPTGAATAAKQDTGNTSLGTIAGAVTGTEMQVDVVASLPAGTNAIGKLAANTGVDIGDVDVTSISAGTNTVGGVISQPSTSTAYDGTTACTIKEFMVVGTTAGNNTIVAAVAAKKIRMLSLQVMALTATANTVYFVNDDYALIATSANPMPIAADADGDNHGGFNSPPSFRRTTDTVNEPVVAVQSATAAIMYMGTYIEVAA